MEGENPTTGDSGASITDRLERFLSDEPATEAKAPVEEKEDSSEVDPSGATEQEEEPQSVVSTADVAKFLGVDESALDVDEDGTIKVKTKIDGKEGTAKFQELLKNYQLQGHAENKARQAAEAEKAANARRAEIEQQATARLQQVEQMANVAAAELMREYQSTDWENLRFTEPGLYAAKKSDFQERGAKLQQVAQAANAERAHIEARNLAEMQKRQDAFVSQQREMLPEIIPEWKDQSIRAREQQEIYEYGLKNGFDKPARYLENGKRKDGKEIDLFFDASRVALLRKAMLYDKQQQSKPAIENKVRAAPKLVKPGQVTDSGPAQQLRNLRTQIKASGGKRGIEEYLIASGKV